MKNKSYGDWTTFPVTIIKNGHHTNILLTKRRKPNGSWEFLNSTNPIVKTLNSTHNKEDVDFSQSNRNLTASPLGNA